ncbi:MAG: ABC transporter permease [Candidatus Dormibacteria bacterium]
MSWRDAWALGLRSLRRRRGRAALTIIAVALAAGLLVALVSIAQTADSRVLSELGKGGPTDAIKVVAAEPSAFQPDADNPAPGKAKDINAVVEKNISSLPEVSAVSPVLAIHALMVPLAPLPAGIPTPTPNPATQTFPRGGVGIPRLPDPFVDSMVGVDFNSIDVLPITVLAGRLPSATSTTEIAVTQGYLDRLHLPPQPLTSVLGTTLEIAEPQVQRPGAQVHFRTRRIRTTIVGVVAQQAGDGQVMVPLAETERAREWALAGVADKDFPLPTSTYSGLLVIASSLDAVHRVRQSVTGLGYSTSAPEHLVASVQKYLHVVDLVLGAIGLVALVIAALGIADALFAAVRERRREISTLKAIGARDRDVVRWFLVEALVIGFFGGLLGAAVGLLVAFGVGVSVNQYLVEQGLRGIDLGGVPVWIVAGGIAGSCTLSVLAGAIPAWRAARLPAFEAIGGGA